ncbi:PAS domain-containing sensor histidine kinase, partial [Dokdonia donghaensis]|uniref:PAS domain-containing sensor histidine kinase n=1 Tax=Dokdonia donghaensis TaxID=326320 RepID=UPI0035C7F3FA
SGSYKWIQDRGKVVKWDDSGNPMRVIGTHTDVTESKHREQLILEKNKLIESHNSRLKNFALIVSHNLITHAGNLKNILQLMDMAESQEEKIELSNYLNDVSAGLSNTISNLNEIATSNRNLEETPKLLFLNDYVNDALNNLKTQIKEKDVVVVNDIPDDIQINYNAAYLESILFNLISNAIKYSDKERQSKVFISAEITSASDITLSVMDNGVGIDLEKYGDKLFGMYKTFHQNEDAQGLGLFMTKNQIEDMGDQISVDSKKDEGTIFRVRFINKLP